MTDFRIRRSEPSLDDTNNILTQNFGDLAADGADRSASQCGASSDYKDFIMGMPTQGIRGRQGPFTGGIARGFVDVGYGLHLSEPARLTAKLAANYNSVVATVGAMYRAGNKKAVLTARGDYRGELTDMQQATSNYKLSTSMVHAKRNMGACRVLESKGHQGEQYNLALPWSTSVLVTPYCYYAVVVKKTSTRLVPEQIASIQLANARALSHKSDVLFKQQARQCITQVHQTNVGDVMNSSQYAERRGGVSVNHCFNIFDMAWFDTYRRQRQAERLVDIAEHGQESSAAAGEISLSSEHQHGWRYQFITFLGLQYQSQTTKSDEYRETKEYKATPEGTHLLESAEASFYEKPMPKLDSAAVTQNFLPPDACFDAGVRPTGALRSQEVACQSVLSWKFNVALKHPGFLTFFSLDRKNTCRKEFDCENFEGRERVIQREIDTRTVDKIPFLKLPEVSEITAQEAWIPAVNDEQTAQLHSLKFAFTRRANAPESAEQLKAHIADYSRLFGQDHTSLDLGPAAMKTTRRIELDSQMGAEEIDDLTQRLAPNFDLDAAARDMQLSASVVRCLQANLGAAQSLKTRCTILRKFVVANGVRAIAFINRINDTPIAPIKISADIALYDTATRYSGVIRTRYCKPMIESTSASEVKDRLWDVQKALNLVHQARACIDQDVKLTPTQRAEQISHLAAEETALRILYRPNSDSVRQAIQNKLRGWHMTQLDCQFYAVFENVESLGTLFDESVVCQRSASAFLRHHDRSMQNLRRVQAGIDNNVLLTDERRAQDAELIASAIARIKADYEIRRTKDCVHAKRWLMRPWQTCGAFWFASLRGWRFFWQSLLGQHHRNSVTFWPANALLALTQ